MISNQRQLRMIWRYVSIKEIKSILQKVLALYLESSIMFYIARGNGFPW